MKLASIKQDGARDGRLHVVSRDLRRAVGAPDGIPTLRHAVEHWRQAAPELERLYDALNAGDAPGAIDFDPRTAAAPLPRAPQWCGGSAFLNHVHLMETAFNMPSNPDARTVPLMYQGGSDDLLGAHDDLPLPDEAHDIDFEGEFGVIVDDVPMGCSPGRAAEHILLLVQINDVSLRALGAREMRAGLGFIHAKPSSSFAPVAVTPDELGDAWRHGRVCLDLEVRHNGHWFGNPNGEQMDFDFGQLIAHVAMTRKLTAGTIIGSGTVSNQGGRKGSACIAERRAIEMIESNQARTAFMKFGDRVQMEARLNGQPVFGAIDQRVVKAPQQR